MKSFNNFISERLKLTKDSKLIPSMSKNDILSYVLAAWGFSSVYNYNPSDTSEMQCVEAIKEWINKYNIIDIKGAYYGGNNASLGYFKSLKTHMIKELDEKAGDNFEYKENISINDIDIWKNKENKTKLKGYDIYIVYNEKSIGIITTGDYKEARVVESY